MLLQDVSEYVPNSQRCDHVLDVLLLVQKAVGDYLLLLRDNVRYLERRLDSAIYLELLYNKLFALVLSELLKAPCHHQI